MSLDRERLPDPVSYYESEGLTLEGRGLWRTTQCAFHGGSHMRIQTQSGGFVCMSGCGAKGGDILAYHRAIHNMDFVTAAIDLGAWVEDGKPLHYSPKPLRIPAKQLLKSVAHDLTLCSLVLSDIRQEKLKDEDYEKFLESVSRIIYVSGVANG